MILSLLALSAASALAQGPLLEVTPSPISFGCTLGGEDSTRSFTIRNTGASDVTIVEFLAPPEFIAPSARDVVVPAGGSIEEVLHFTPLSAGPATRSGSLEIRTATESFLVPVSGEIGAEPTIGVNPTRVDFGDIALGSSREICITVSNPSCRPIDVLSATIANTAFTITQGFATPHTLGPFEEQRVCITFAPTTPGDEQGEVVFEGALGKRAIVRLDGRGVRAEIAVEPATVSFGPVEIGTSSPEVVVEIVNHGGQSARIDPGLAIGGANPGDFVLTSAPLPFDVGPGERAPLRIRFVPTALGPRSAEITVNNSSEIDPIVRLEGTGARFDVVVTPSEVDMGDVFVGQSRIAIDTVRVLNRGSDPVTITGTTIEGADPAAFERYGFVVARIGPGEFYVLDIEFKPDAPRVFNAELVLTLENGATFRVPLRGRGLDTAAPRPRRIAGDTIRMRVGERRMIRFTIDPPLGGSDTARRVLVRLSMDPLALYPHRVVAEGVTATRSYSGDGVAELIFSSPDALRLAWFDLEVEGLFTGRSRNRVSVDSVDLGDPRIGVTTAPGLVMLEGCDIGSADSLLRSVRILSIAPNPARAKGMLRYRSAGGARLRIVSLDGRTLDLVALPPTPDAGGSIDLAVDGLAAGGYIVEITDDRSSDRRLLEVSR